MPRDGLCQLRGHAASSAFPGVSAGLCLPVCGMGRWGSRLSRGPPALRWEGLVAFQKRGPPLVVSKLPVLLELIKPRRRWSRLSDAQGLRCQESTLLVPVNSWAPAEFAGWARLLSSSLHCAPDRGRQGGKETQDRASWCASWPTCGGGGRLRTIIGSRLQWEGLGHRRAAWPIIPFM